MSDVYTMYKNGIPANGIPLSPTFESETAVETSYTPEITGDNPDVGLVQSGEPSRSLWSKVAKLFKNMRWLNAFLGTNDEISAIKEMSETKTIGGAINTLNNTLDSSLNNMHKGDYYGTPLTAPYSGANYFTVVNLRTKVKPNDYTVEITDVQGASTSFIDKSKFTIDKREGRFRAYTTDSTYKDYIIGFTVS